MCRSVTSLCPGIFLSCMNVLYLSSDLPEAEHLPAETLLDLCHVTLELHNIVIACWVLYAKKLRAFWSLSPFKTLSFVSLFLMFFKNSSFTTGTVSLLRVSSV